MDRFEMNKRACNLAGGYLEAKGLKDGHCNRYACQAPLAGTRQAFMSDHETHVYGAKLYYCGPCAELMNAHDRRVAAEPRCTFEAPA